MMILHNIKSFIKTGYKEWTTYVGIFGFLFFIHYHTELDHLVKHILGSDELMTTCVNGLASLAAYGFIAYRHDKKDE